VKTVSVDLQIAAHFTSPNNAVAPSLENNKLLKILFIKKYLLFAKIKN
jgi:hypothetical protein